MPKPLWTFDWTRKFADDFIRAQSLEHLIGPVERHKSDEIVWGKEYDVIGVVPWLFLPMK
jgi:hypothetical protein